MPRGRESQKQEGKPNGEEHDGEEGKVIGYKKVVGFNLLCKVELGGFSRLRVVIEDLYDDRGCKRSIVGLERRVERGC
jgi:hypothetical protein